MYAANTGLRQAARDSVAGVVGREAAEATAETIGSQVGKTAAKEVTEKVTEGGTVVLTESGKRAMVEAGRKTAATTGSEIAESASEAALKAQNQAREIAFRQTLGKNASLSKTAYERAMQGAELTGDEWASIHENVWARNSFVELAKVIDQARKVRRR